MSKMLCPTLANTGTDYDCGNARPKSPFNVIHNGKDRATVINIKGEDVTEHFNIGFEHGIIKVDFKKVPSFEEWRKIAGK